MALKRQGGGFAPVYLPRWQYRGGQTILPAGASVAATVPSGAHIFEIRAEGGPAYYEINGASASANSHGYVADGGGAVVGPLSNLNSLHVFAAVGDTVHIQYYEESE